METLILARHAESELSIHGILNGDPRLPCALTARGEAQARELGRAIRGESIELSITSEFERCRQTARIALADREVSWLRLPELGDVRNGVFEGGPIADYLSWARNAPADESPPGGGESRVDAARRFADGIRIVLGRPEATALLVSHQLPAGYVLAAARGRLPSPQVDSVPYAHAFALTAEELVRAAGMLEIWAREPDW